MECCHSQIFWVALELEEGGVAEMDYQVERAVIQQPVVGTSMRGWLALAAYSKDKK